jgi:ABC-2 type transport system permease protein
LEIRRADPKDNWLVYLLDIYRRLLGVQIRSQMTYRTSFILETLAMFLIIGFEFSSLALIFWRFDNLGGWKLGEVAVLYGLTAIGFGIMDLVFSGFDPGNFGRQIRLGALDQIMLRPVSITVQVLGSAFELRRIGRIAQGCIILGLAFTLTGIHWTLAKVALIPLVLFGVVCFFGGLFVIGATITFWTVESVEVMNIFTYGGNEMMSYPMNIYPNWMRRFFTFILPAIFLVYYPTLYLLEKPDPFNFPPFAPWLSPLAGLVVLLAALRFWRFGLNHYQSTGT